MHRKKAKEGVVSKGKGEFLPIYIAIFYSFVEQVLALGQKLSRCFDRWELLLNVGSCC